jgi:hypothetical protein
MNSFKLTAVGQLARNPELSIRGAITFARFCLVGNDTIAESERDGPRDVVTSLWFLAFGEIATTIARRSREGRPAHPRSEGGREPLGRHPRGKAVRPYVHCHRLPLRCETRRTRIAHHRSPRPTR